MVCINLVFIYLFNSPCTLCINLVFIYLFNSPCTYYIIAGNLQQRNCYIQHNNETTYQQCFAYFRSGGTLLKIKWAWSHDWAWPMAMKLNKQGFSLIDMFVKICHIYSIVNKQYNNIFDNYLRLFDSRIMLVC